jgi:hypothetical protein
MKKLFIVSLVVFGALMSRPKVAAANDLENCMQVMANVILGCNLNETSMDQFIALQQFCGY